MVEIDGYTIIAALLAALSIVVPETIIPAIILGSIPLFKSYLFPSDDESDDKSKSRQSGGTAATLPLARATPIGDGSGVEGDYNYHLMNLHGLRTQIPTASAVSPRPILEGNNDFSENSGDDYGNEVNKSSSSSSKSTFSFISNFFRGGTAKNNDGTNSNGNGNDGTSKTPIRGPRGPISRPGLRSSQRISTPSSQSPAAVAIGSSNAGPGSGLRIRDDRTRRSTVHRAFTEPGTETGLPTVKITDMRGQTIQVNTDIPIPFETDYFKGDILVMIKCQGNLSAYDRYKSYFLGKERMFEIQIQGQFKYNPTGTIFVGGEVDGVVTLASNFIGMIASMILKLCKRFFPYTHFSYGSSNSSNNGSGNEGKSTANGRYEKAHLSFPLYQSADRLIMSEPKPGCPPPTLGEGELPESDADRNKRKKTKVVGIVAPGAGRGFGGGATSTSNSRSKTNRDSNSHGKRQRYLQNNNGDGVDMDDDDYDGAGDSHEVEDHDDDDSNEFEGGPASYGNDDDNTASPSASSETNYFKMGPTYSFSIQSNYFDFAEWKICNVPGFSSISASSILGQRPITVVMYEVNQQMHMMSSFVPDMYPHFMRCKRYLMAFEFSHISISQEGKLPTDKLQQSMTQRKQYFKYGADWNEPPKRGVLTVSERVLAPVLALPAPWESSPSNMDNEFSCLPAGARVLGGVGGSTSTGNSGGDYVNGKAFRGDIQASSHKIGELDGHAVRYHSAAESCSSTGISDVQMMKLVKVTVPDDFKVISGDIHRSYTDDEDDDEANEVINLSKSSSLKDMSGERERLIRCGDVVQVVCNKEEKCLVIDRGLWLGYSHSNIVTLRGLFQVTILDDSGEVLYGEPLISGQPFRLRSIRYPKYEVGCLVRGSAKSSCCKLVMYEWNQKTNQQSPMVWQYGTAMSVNPLLLALIFEGVEHRIDTLAYNSTASKRRLFLQEKSDASLLHNRSESPSTFLPPSSSAMSQIAHLIGNFDALKDPYYSYTCNLVAWTYMLHRTTKMKALAYVIESTFQHTEQSKPVKWISLRTGTELESILSKAETSLGCVRYSDDDDEGVLGGEEFVTSDFAFHYLNHHLRRPLPLTHESAVDQNFRLLNIRLARVLHNLTLPPLDDQTQEEQDVLVESVERSLFDFCLLPRILDSWLLKSASDGMDGSLGFDNLDNCSSDSFDAMTSASAVPIVKSSHSPSHKKSDGGGSTGRRGGGVSGSRLGLGGTTKKNLSVMALRAIYEHHYEEEILTLSEVAILMQSSFQPQQFRIPLLDITSVSAVKDDETPLIGLAMLRIETVEKVHYIVFNSSSTREKLLTHLLDYLSSINLATHRRYLVSARSTNTTSTSSSSSSSNSPMTSSASSANSPTTKASSESAMVDVTSDKYHAFRSKQWTPTKYGDRLILNSRRMSFDSLGSNCNMGGNGSTEEADPYWMHSVRLLRGVFELGALKNDEGDEATEDLRFGVFDDASMERFVSFLDDTVELKRIHLQEIDPLSTEAFCFFCNVFHTLLLHARLVLDLPTKQTWSEYYTTVCYEIGDDVFSLAELEFCVLRGGALSKYNRSYFQNRHLSRWTAGALPAADSSQFAYALGFNDKRAHFLINHGSVSGLEEIYLITPSTLELHSAAATCKAISTQLVVDFHKRLLILPKVCDVYLSIYSTFSDGENFVPAGRSGVVGGVGGLFFDQEAIIRTNIGMGKQVLQLLQSHSRHIEENSAVASAIQDLQELLRVGGGEGDIRVGVRGLRRKDDHYSNDGSDDEDDDGSDDKTFSIRYSKFSCEPRSVLQLRQ